jgi:hypothetical protein
MKARRMLKDNQHRIQDARVYIDHDIYIARASDWAYTRGRVYQRVSFGLFSIIKHQKNMLVAAAAEGFNGGN